MEPDDSRLELGPEDLRYAIQILDKFELDVQNGVARPIEDVVPGLTETLRNYVILGCTRIEIECSESVSLEQREAYLQRFPEIRQELEKEFAAWRDKMKPPIPVSPPPRASQDPEDAGTAPAPPQGAPPEVDGYELL